MECRDVRPLIRRRHMLADIERQRVELHLHTCGACRDEADDALAISFASVSLSMAIPPPDFTRQVLLRLPAEAPIAIEQRRLRLQRLYRAVAAAGLGVLIVLALSGFILLYFSTQRAADHVPSIGLPLALAAKALLDAAGKPLITAIAVAAALLAPLLVRRNVPSIRTPLAGRLPVLAGGALAVLLLINSLAVRGEVGHIATSFQAPDFVPGSVTSIGGDIRVDGDVRGDVVALAGNVILGPKARVGGSVMSGTGIVKHTPDQVAQAVINGIAPTTLLLEATGNSAGRLAPEAVERIVGLLAALLTLMLGGFLVISWPHGTANAAAYLRHHPGRALALGLLATLGLAVLALGGAVLLAATVGGVLLIPLLLALLHLPYVGGVAAVGQMLGERLSGHPTTGSALWGIAAQIVLVIALGLLIPTAGLLTFYLFGSIGLGAALLVPRGPAVSRQ